MSTELVMNPVTWKLVREQADVLFKSGFLPLGVKSPEAAVAIMMKGNEIGFKPMQAFAHIHVINGKTGLSAEGMLALIHLKCPKAKILFQQLDNEVCRIAANRPGELATIFTFLIEDAKRAGLLGKPGGNWEKYPRAMLRSRCISEMARTLFPDIITGFSYTPEELDPDLEVNEEGEVIDMHKAPFQNTPLPDIAAQQATVVRPDILIFNTSNDLQLDKLLKKLEDEKIPSGLHDEIAHVLNGQPFTVKNVEETISKIRG